MAGGRRLGGHRIPVELVVPEHKEGAAFVDLVEGGAQRIDGRVADAAAAAFQRMVGTAGKSELLAELLVRLNRAAKRTCPLSASTAARKRFRIALEHKPPV